MEGHWLHTLNASWIPPSVQIRWPPMRSLEVTSTKWDKTWTSRVLYPSPTSMGSGWRTLGVVWSGSNSTTSSNSPSSMVDWSHLVAGEDSFVPTSEDSEALKVTMFRCHSLDGSVAGYMQVRVCLMHLEQLGRVSSHYAGLSLMWQGTRVQLWLRPKKMAAIGWLGPLLDP